MDTSYTTAIDNVANRINAWSAPERNWVVRNVATRSLFVGATAGLVLAGLTYNLTAAVLKAPLATIQLLTGRLPERYSFGHLIQGNVKPFVRSIEALLKVPGQLFVCDDFAAALRTSRDHIFPGQRAPVKTVVEVEQPKQPVEQNNNTTEADVESPLVVAEQPKSWKNIGLSLLAGGAALVVIGTAIRYALYNGCVERLKEQCDADKGIFDADGSKATCVLPGQRLNETACPGPLTYSLVGGTSADATEMIASITRPAGTNSTVWDACTTSIVEQCHVDNSYEAVVDDFVASCHFKAPDWSVADLHEKGFCQV